MVAKPPYRYQILIVKAIDVLKLCALVLMGWCIAAPAQAGLFADDDARKKIQQLETRLLKLDGLINQQTKSMLDLQGQIDGMNGEIRQLRGQNEELAHGLQDAEKRSKDFYIDLDARLRHFESAEAEAEKAAKEAPADNANSTSATAPLDPPDPSVENRAFEHAYALLKGDSHANAAKAFQEFISKYPGSVHVPNAKFWLGHTLYKLNNFRGSMEVHKELLDTFPGAPKAPEAMLNIASCQRKLKLVLGAKKTLKELVAKYPDSEAAAEAKKLLSAKK